MIIKIKYFGMAIDASGKRNEDIEINEDITIGQLKELINGKYNKLKQIRYKIACNQELINNEELIIIDQSEIAVLPAFAGG